ncbi:glycosyltransferase family 1 protein, partial [Patescibacteria group bacterium]|nr:glycosyltransferase family 1 protein [Patescibacteria group bacterium]
CLPEVYQDSALFFDPLNATDLSKKILSLLNKKQERLKFVKKGKKLLGQFSWEKMSNQTKSIYYKISG